MYKWYFNYVIFSIRKAIVFSNILRSKCFLQYFLVALIDLINSVIISNDLNQMVNIPTWIPDCDCHSFVLLDLFISSDISICSTMAFSPFGNSDHVVVSVPIDFLSNSQQDAPFHCIAYDYSHADGDSLCNHLRDVPWEDIFNLSTSAAAASEFCEWLQDGINVYIPHHKYQAKPHSSPWFSAACAAAIAHRNPFFHLYQQNKPSQSKLKFRQASNHCKRVLEAAKLACANKTKEYITSEKLGSWDFWQISNKVLSKGKSAMPSLFNAPEVLSSTYLIKQNCLLKTFLRTPILMTQVSLYMFSLLELIWNCIFF